MGALDLVLVDVVQISAPPAPIVAWLENLDRHYRDWHPEHNRLTVLSGTLDGPESTVEFDEFLGRWRYVYRVRLRRFRQGEEQVVRYTGLRLRDRLVLAWGEMRIAPIPNGSVFTAVVALRFGKLLRWAARGRIAALRKHMAEEGVALQRRFAAVRA